MPAISLATLVQNNHFPGVLSGVARVGTGGDNSPPVILIIDFDIFLNLKGKVRVGGTTIV